MTMRDLFELKYSSHVGMHQEDVKALRMSNGSYSLPKPATAWRWFECGYLQGKLAMESEQDAKR